MLEGFAENDGIPRQLASGAMEDTTTIPKVICPPGRRPDIDMSEHDESLASPVRNPVFAIKTIIINKQDNSGEITDETSRTTRTEEEEETSDVGEDTMDETHCYHQKNRRHESHDNRNQSHSRRNTNGSRSETYIQEVANIVSNIPNEELDNLSTQSPFSVPTVDLFPVDSQHSILTNDDFNTSLHTVSKRSNNSLALSPSVSQRGAVTVSLSADSASSVAARRRPAKSPALRPVERTNSFIQRRNKRLEQIKNRVMSRKQQRMQEQKEQNQNNRLLEEVQEDEEEDFYDDEMEPLESPSQSSRQKVAVAALGHKDKSSVATSPTTTTSSSPVTSSGGSSSAPRRCYSADRGRKESRGITVRDNSPLSTKSENRPTSRKIKIEHRRSSQRSTSVCDGEEPTSPLKGRQNSTSPAKSRQNPATESAHVPQSPGSQSSSQYRSHRQEQDHYNHLEEELTMANLIISQQQEQIKALQDTNKELQTRFDHSQAHHEEQLEKTSRSLYQAQKKQEKTEQDLHLALIKINSLNELHAAVAKIQQLTGLQLLGTGPLGGDDVSIKSDGTKSVKSAPHLASSSSRGSKTKKELLSPLAENSQTNYLSDASDSDGSEIQKEISQHVDSKGAATLEVPANQHITPIRRFSGSNIPEKSSTLSRSSNKVKQPKSPTTSFAPVVPSRQDQSQASFLDSALSRKNNGSSARQYSSHH